MSTVGWVSLLIAISSGALTSALGAAGRLRGARVAATALVAALVAATISLTAAIARSDYSLSYVAEQSRARSSSGYRIAALWGGAEGSLLFFASLLSLVFLWLVWRGRIARWAMATSAATITTMAVTVAAFADPFERATIPAIRGAGLTPILEHPAMLYHPPILYLGLVATLVPFAVVVDRATQLTAADLRVVRSGALLSWTLLTIGLATGANWAYVEVGWGGYWAWDPVENTVLMPWLVLTAGIHLLRSPATLREFPRSTAALLSAPFLLVLFGAAVTRSGGLSSVHAFADADALGWMLGSLVVTITGLVGLRIWLRGRSPASDIGPLALPDRFIAITVVLSLAMAVAVLLGVGVPIVPGSNRVVTAPYYNRVGVPVLVLAMLALAWLPLGRNMKRSGRRTALATVGSIGALAIALALGVGDWLSLTVVALGGAIVTGHAWDARSRLASVVGHIGFVVLALGIVGAAQSVSQTSILQPGDTETFGSNLELTYESFAVTDGPRAGSEAVTTRTVVVDGSTGNQIAVLSPGLVSYPDRAVVLAETALHSTPRRDIQVVVRTITEDGLASFVLAERPAQMLVWWGTAIITIAGAIAIAGTRRHRGPSRSRDQSSAESRRFRDSSASSVEVGAAVASSTEGFSAAGWRGD